jgi:hypothetical protein
MARVAAAGRDTYLCLGVKVHPSAGGPKKKEEILTQSSALELASRVFWPIEC